MKDEEAGVARKEWNAEGQLCRSRVEKRRLQEDGGKTVGSKRGRKRKKKGERQRGRAVTKKDARENATREDPEESGGTFPPLLSVTHFSFTLFPLLRLSNSVSFSLSCHPSARPSAALFMTLSTSLAAVFLRHYTWKNFVPGKLDIESHECTRSLPEKRARSVCPVYPRRKAHHRRMR